MSDLRPEKSMVTVDLDGEEYGLLFDINAIDEIQDKFDIPISELSSIISDERKQFKVIRYLVSLLINEGIDETNERAGEKRKRLDEKSVGRKIRPDNMSYLAGKILEAFSAGTPQKDNEDEGDDPNPKSE